MERLFMANKIKKIKLGNDEAREVYDVDSTHTINGYSNAVIENQTVTFANKPITDADIDSVLNGTYVEESN